MSIIKLLSIQLFILLLFAVGWIKNIIKLTECDFEKPYKAEIIHGAGLVTPICIVTGWLDLGK